MFARLLAALLGTLHTGNGLFMVLASRRWFDQVAGVSDTGPFNPHFVTDIGLAFMASGVAFLLLAWRPEMRLVALGASGFVVLHALLHVSLLLQGHNQYWVADLLGVVLPAAIGILLTWPRKEPHYVV